MSSENENGFDSTSSRTRKRMLPSVAEIARELSRRTAADAASILTTSRKVCAEELIRIKEGSESVPIDVLVERARVLLEQESQTAAGTSIIEPPPPLPAAPSVPAPPLAEGADPFGETMGRLDLRWEGNAEGNAMESPGRGQDHGDGQEIPPEPQRSPFEMSFPLPDLPPGSEPDAGQSPASPAPLAFSLDEPFAAQPAKARAPAPARVPLQAPPARQSKLPFFLVIAALAVAAGGAAWYFLSGPSKPDGPPPSLAVKRKPNAAPAEISAQSASPSISQPPVPAVASAAAQVAPTPPGAPGLPATPAWIKSSGVPPAPSAVATRPQPATKATAESVAPEPVPVEPKAKPTPAVTTVSSSPKAPKDEASKPTVEKTIPASSRKEERAVPSAAQVQVRAGTLVTLDWMGAPIHVVHFSSFQEKARAEKHAAVLAKELGIPARAVQVDLGDKGLWYRAVVGEFATAEEALALRSQLLEKGTPGVGLVYRMTPKK